MCIWLGASGLPACFMMLQSAWICARSSVSVGAVLIWLSLIKPPQSSSVCVYFSTNPACRNLFQSTPACLCRSASVSLVSLLSSIPLISRCLNLFQPVSINRNVLKSSRLSSQVNARSCKWYTCATYRTIVSRVHEVRPHIIPLSVNEHGQPCGLNNFYLFAI